MFEAEEDGAITEMELAVILRTALGVTHLSVSRLFAAIDSEDTGKITFGKRTNKVIKQSLAIDWPKYLLSESLSQNWVCHQNCCHLFCLEAVDSTAWPLFYILFFFVSGALLWSFHRQVQMLFGAAPRLCWGVPAHRKHRTLQRPLPRSPNKAQLVFP